MATSVGHVRIHVHQAPIAANNRSSNLGRRLSLLRELVGKHRFLLTNIAFRSVRAGEAIEQALVSGVPVAIAVARLLI